MNNEVNNEMVYQEPRPTNVMPTLPAKYKPISAWGYVGYQLLFCIPLVGFIFMLVFALGGTKNENLKNFSRSYFCWMLIGLAIAAVIGLIFLILFFIAAAGTSAA